MSIDPKLAAKVQRMIRPEALTKNEPLVWSAGTGTDVWELFCACITGDLETVTRLVNEDPSLVRSHYEYRTPLSFAVRENQVSVAAFLLDHGADLYYLGDELFDIARDRWYVEMERVLTSTAATRHGPSSNAATVRERKTETLRRLRAVAPELRDIWTAAHFGDLARVRHLLDEDLRV